MYLIPYIQFCFNHKLPPTFNSYASQLSTIEIPKSVKKAICNPNWKEAMLE